MCVFKGILACLASGPKSTQDFPGLLLFFVGIMPDKVILDNENGLEIFIFCEFFGQFLLKIAKICVNLPFIT